jgi:hypothetical protein
VWLIHPAAACVGAVQNYLVSAPASVGH